MNGVSLCARCGLERSSGGANRITRRAALVGLLSSGFLAKLLLGAVAVAAVGGVAATMPRTTPYAPFEAAATTQTLLQVNVPVKPEALAATEEAMPATEALVENVHEYAMALQMWGDCVSEAARGHSGTSFDPKTACGETPAAAAYGFSDRRPSALVKADEKAADKDETDDAAETKADEKAEAAETKADEKAADKDEKAEAAETKADEKAADKDEDRAEEPDKTD